ncbi:MAG TPA: hypothetical protein VK066_30145 [Chloroflexota bacterium]|nr:hypothetical protein [Chloroflexota bacterium]
MGDLAPAASAGTQPTMVFGAELHAAAVQERARRVLKADKKAALAGLGDDDLGRLSETFEALLRGPADVGALAAELEAALRALSPAAALEGEGDA